MISITDSEGHIITAETSMKILGFTMNAHVNMETHLARVKSKIGMELAKLKPQLKYMTLDDQKLILNAKLRSIIDYGMPLMMGKNESMLQKIESVYMYINRIIQGGYNFRSNKTKVCKDIKVDLPRQLMCKAAVRYLH